MALTLGLGMVLVPAASASASPPQNVAPSLTVNDGLGDPAQAVDVGDVLNTKAEAPITDVGQTGQRIVTSWDPTQESVNPGSIVTPEGWTRQYTTDGTTWQDNVPTDPTTISGVRTDGSVQSDGYSGGLQVSTSTGTGTVVTGAGAIAGTSGGDGWDAFTSDTLVLNTWHHNGGAYNLDCHYKATGDSCGSVYSVANYTTSMGASGAVVNHKVYSVVGENASGTYGVLCTDIASIPFTSCGYTALYDAGSTAYQAMGTQTLSGTKVYGAMNAGKLMCFDTATSAPCVGQPYALSGYSQTLSNMAAFTTAINGQVFVTANQLWCFDGATGNACSGSWPVGDFGGSVHSAVPMRATDGTVTGVCMILPAGTCYDLTGASVTFPSALATMLTNFPVGAASQVGIGNYGFTGTRQYWFIGNWGASDNTPVCWDWAAQSACAGFDGSAAFGTVRYAIDVDSTNSNCLWTNGDNGQISSFNGTTGAVGCASTDPTAVIPYTTLVPRMGCDEAGRVRAFRDLTLTVPDGVSLTALRVTVQDSDGNAVPGFVDLNPDSSGVIDLSALDPAVTGTQPSFAITSPDTSTSDAEAITAALRFDSDAPQLCMTLVSLQDCPTMAVGVSSTPAVPVSDVVIDGATIATVNSVDTTTPLSASVTRGDMSNCLGTVSGTAERSFPGGSALLPGATVRLLDDDDNVLASTTTAYDGTYSFANVRPGTYRVTVAGQSATRTVAATTTAVADFSVPVSEPVAGPVTATTLQNSPATLAIQASVDPSTTVDLTSVELFNPGTSTWGASLVVAGEGTWTVTSGGDLRFTPLAGAVGTTTPVTYRFSDGYGTASEGSTARVTVLAVLPTAAAVSGTGVRGATVSLTPNGVSTAVPLADHSLRLIDPVSHVAVTTYTKAHVGTFTVNPATGKVDFTPLGTFVGSVTAIYQVSDTLNRVAIATMTFRLTPIVLSRPLVTVNLNATGHLHVTGVPSGSVVTLPTAVANAASVSNRGGDVRVQPKAGFSGRITVRVTVVHGTARLFTSAVVLVRPAVAAHGWHDLTAEGGTVVHWGRSSGAISYQVRVNGVLRCVTSATACDVSALLGPKAVVTVTSVGHNAVVGKTARVPYRVTECVSIGDIYFATASSSLGASAKGTLRSFAALINAQGFTHGCLVGHTDSRGSVAANKALSKLRVHAAAAYLKARTAQATYVLRYSGELAPAAPNNTAAGRAKNRRVEIGVA